MKKYETMDCEEFRDVIMDAVGNALTRVHKNNKSGVQLHDDIGLPILTEEQLEEMSFEYSPFNNEGRIVFYPEEGRTVTATIRIEEVSTE